MGSIRGKREVKRFDCEETQGIEGPFITIRTKGGETECSKIVMKGGNNFKLGS